MVSLYAIGYKWCKSCRKYRPPELRYEVDGRTYCKICHYRTRNKPKITKFKHRYETRLKEMYNNGS